MDFQDNIVKIKDLKVGDQFLYPAISYNMFPELFIVIKKYKKELVAELPYNKAQDPYVYTATNVKFAGSNKIETVYGSPNYYIKVYKKLYPKLIEQKKPIPEVKIFPLNDTPVVQVKYLRSKTHFELHRLIATMNQAKRNSFYIDQGFFMPTLRDVMKWFNSLTKKQASDLIKKYKR